MVHSMVDFFLLLLLAGAGDELQGIKRGIMEMADGLAVTKADGDNDKRAKLAQRELKNAIHLFPPTTSGWIPEVHTCSSVTGEQIDEVRNMIFRFEEHAKIKGAFQQKRKDQDRNWMHETLRSLLLEGLYLDPVIHQRMLEMEEAVRSGKISAFEAAEFIYHLYKK